MQTDVKRMLAYSSINHAGFILVGVQAASADGMSARALLPGRLHVHGRRHLRRRHPGRPRGDGAPRARRLPRASAQREPLLALAFTVFLLAQAGVPFTSGFFAKFYVIDAAVEARSYWLAIVAMVSAVIAAFLYLRIVLAMYAGADEEDEAAEPAPAAGPAPGAVRWRPSPWSSRSSPPSASASCPTPSPRPPGTPPPSWCAMTRRFDAAPRSGFAIRCHIALLRGAARALTPDIAASARARPTSSVEFFSRRFEPVVRVATSEGVLRTTDR